MSGRIDSPNTQVDIDLHAHLDGDRPSSFVIRAGAGSGKTTSLIKALAHLIEAQKESLSRNRQQIVCITYTDIARDEIARDVGENPLIHVSTIHSYLWELCRPFKSDVSAFVRTAIETRISSLTEVRAGFAAKPRTRQTTIDKNETDIARAALQLRDFDPTRSFTYGMSSNYDAGTLGHDDILKLGSMLITSKPLLARLVAQRNPFFFVDESQDTMPAIVEALKKIASEHSDRFCLGFFGDPMQQIYASGIGEIEPETGWASFDKPENFRSSQAVLGAINKIRSKADDLVQIGGRFENSESPRTPILGSARLFVLPVDEKRQENLTRVRQWLAHENRDSLWLGNEEEGEVRILVIVHRMAAIRLGFPKLYSAFNDKVPDKYKSAFQEGEGWLLAPVTKFALPLAKAHNAGDKAEVMKLLRANCEQLAPTALESEADLAALFSRLSGAVSLLSELVSPQSNGLVRDVFQVMSDHKLIPLDNRIINALAMPDFEMASTELTALDSNDPEVAPEIASNFLSCDASELSGYGEYVGSRSPYATHQGVKGAEFERVVVVLDDDEGTHNQFSYGKLLGITDLSKTDELNQANGSESVVERTLRLFYVCCSRARLDLAVVLYAADHVAALEKLRQGEFFAAADVLSLDQLAPV